MFVGHVGAAMVLHKAERRVNVGAFIFAALLLDVVLWAFVLLGWEQVRIPGDFATRHQLEFFFPYSHGLVTALGWSLLIAGLALIMVKLPSGDRPRAALLLGAAAFSHWLLDALVHRPELPVLGEASAKVGLSWWNHLPLALAVESALAAVGLWLYVRGGGLSTWEKVRAIGLVGFLIVMTIAGMTVAPPPPNATQLAASSFSTLIVVIALFLWNDSWRVRILRQDLS